MNPCLKQLRFGKKSLDVFVVPGGEVMMTVDYPAWRLADTRLWGPDYKGRRTIWFEGDYNGLNTALQEVPYCLDLSDELDQMPLRSVQQLKDLVLAHDKAVRRQLQNDSTLSSPVRHFMQMNLTNHTFSIISAAKIHVLFACVMRKERPENLNQDAHFEDELWTLDSIQSPSMMYFDCYADLVEMLQGRGMTERACPWWKDITRCKGAIAKTLGKMSPLPDSLLARVDTLIQTPAIRKCIYARHQEYRSALEQAASEEGTHTVCSADASLQGDALLQFIASRHKGRVTLIDFWATWCAPCLRAMKLMQPLKERLKDLDIDYVFITDEISPKALWRKMIADMHGEHYQLTNDQNVSLMNLFGFTVIPSYLILDREGKVVYQQMAFPGEEEMETLLRNAL